MQPISNAANIILISELSLFSTVDRIEYKVKKVRIRVDGAVEELKTVSVVGTFATVLIIPAVLARILGNGSTLTIDARSLIYLVRLIREPYGPIGRP